MVPKMDLLGLHLRCLVKREETESLTLQYVGEGEGLVASELNPQESHNQLIFSEHSVV